MSQWRRNITRSVFTLLTSSCILLVSVAKAQVGPEAQLSEIPRLYISASPSPGERISQIGMTTINEVQIKAGGYQTLEQVLEQASGIHIDSSGAGMSSVYLRGADPNHTLVLIDGVRVNDPTNSRGGSFDFSSISAEQIQSVEIRRGAASAVYGSDALAGVIHITTKKGSKNSSSSVFASLGTEDFAHAAATMRAARTNGGHSLHASYLDSAEEIVGSEGTARTALASADWSVSDALSLQLAGRATEQLSRGFPDDSGGAEFAVLRDREKREAQRYQLVGSAEYRFSEALLTLLTLSAFSMDEDIDSPGVAPGIRDSFGIPSSESESEFSRYSATLLQRYAPTPQLLLVAGGEYLLEEGRTDGLLNIPGSALPTDFSFSRHSLAPLAELSLEPWEGALFSAGIRIDFPEEFGSRASPRMSLFVPVADEVLGIKMRWSSGYKLPSFFALGNAVVGNPELRAETSDSYELGVVATFFEDAARFELTGFYTQYDNLIDFEEGPPPRLVNRDEVVAKGIEATLNLELTEALAISSFVTFVDTDIKNSSEELRNRPRWRGGSSVQYAALEDLRTFIRLVYVGEVLDSSIPTGALTLDDYVRTDIGASYLINEEVNLEFQILNLLDRSYEQAVGFNSTGLLAKLGIRASF